MNRIHEGINAHVTGSGLNKRRENMVKKYHTATQPWFGWVAFMFVNVFFLYSFFSTLNWVVISLGETILF